MGTSSFFVFVPFWLILAHFWVLNPRLVDGVGRTNVRPYGGRRRAMADTQVWPYGWPPRVRGPQGPPLRRACRGQGRHADLPLSVGLPGKAATRAAPTLTCRGQGRHAGLPLRWGVASVRPLMPWRTSGPRAGTGRVWAWVVAVPALAGGRICSPTPRGAGPAACAGVRGCLPSP